MAPFASRARRGLGLAKPRSGCWIRALRSGGGCPGRLTGSSRLQRFLLLMIEILHDLSSERFLIVLA